MLAFSMTVDTEGLEGVFAYLGDLQERLVDLMPLGQRLGEIMREENYNARGAGLDAFGEPFAPIKDATWEMYPRFSGHERGPGPPLAPEGPASRIMAGFDVEVYRGLGASEVVVLGSWPTMPFLRFHCDGYSSRWGHPVPPRDPAGLTPEAWRRMTATFDESVDEIIHSS